MILPVVEKAFHDAAVLKGAFGKVQSGINFGAPLDNAVSVYGEEILAACVGEPELATWVLRQMAEAILVVYDKVSSVIDETPGDPREAFFSLGNCPVCMIRPKDLPEGGAAGRPVDAGAVQGALLAAPLRHLPPLRGRLQAAQSHRARPRLGHRFAGGAGCLPRPADVYLYRRIRITRDHAGEGVDAIVSKIVNAAGPHELLTGIAVAEIGPDITDETVRDLMTAGERIDT